MLEVANYSDMPAENKCGLFCVLRCIGVAMSDRSHAAAAPGSAFRYRFGVFELDARSGELRRNGAKVRLQEQPFLVLRKLLESGGGLVTREELHGALWPADTFVDFDTSLNTAIKRLREALGDSADIPVFIETLPRRGYRFLAPVQVIKNGECAAVPAEEPGRAKPSRHFRLGLVIAGLLLAAAVGGLTVAVRSPAPMPRVSDAAQLTFDENTKGNLEARAGSIYFNEQRGGQVVLAKIPEAGGLPVILDSSNNGLYLADVSTDGKKLLVISPEDRVKGTSRLMLMDQVSGSLQDLTGIDCNDAAWAPDGKLIYAKDQNLFIANSDGSQPRKLLSAPGRIFYMRFSPDGTRLRFSVGKKITTESSLWEAHPDGSGLHEILTNLKDFPQKCCGAWSPDGRYYFFQTNQNGSSKIWVREERSSIWGRDPASPVQLTTVPPNYYMGVPSQNGKQLIVTAAQPRAELERYDSASRQFVPFLSGISAGDVETSRDGRSLVYVKYPEATLWRSKADGTEATQLTGTPLRAYLPHWSPDGKQVAFAGSRLGHPWNIFLIPSSGGPAEQITNGALADLDPTWSPDGTKLGFGQLRQVGNSQVNSIQIMDLATRRITSFRGSEGICCPRWSPDGRFILASNQDYTDLFLYEFASQKWTVIVKGLGPIGYMEWTNDGKDVVFDTFESEEPAFYRIRVSDLHLETIAKVGNLRRYYAEFGPWSGIAPDGSPLLVRDISNEEIYSLDLKLP
jgi:Tol biopolymer transport system component/DNA-binding winged helix-turn-helix (wHTH) protein